MARLTARARMHAATSFYRPTLPAWENRAPSLRSRAPGDETLRSALLEALDLSQQSLCTTAGHDRLLGLLGGGTGGAVEALTRALVGAIEHNNDRRVGPLCALAARTLASRPSAALAAVRAARRAGVDAIVARLEHTVVDLTVHSCDILSELEDALRLEPRDPSARLHTVSDERFWGAIDERDPRRLGNATRRSRAAARASGPCRGPHWAAVPHVRRHLSPRTTAALPRLRMRVAGALQRAMRRGRPSSQLRGEPPPCSPAR